MIHKEQRRQRSWGALALVAFIGITGALVSGAMSWAAANPVSEPTSSGGPTTFRRLNEMQYLVSIKDIFGPDIKVPGRFEPPLREEGLLAIGDSKVGVSSSGFEQYELRAREIAAQVLSEKKRSSFMPCEPKTQPFDSECAEAFFSKYGRLLFRRPLTNEEKAATVKMASTATEKTGNYHRGLQAGLARLLVSPNFIFRVERTQPQENESSTAVQRLDDYSLASRISFLLWNAPPDPQLLDAAETGALRTHAGIEREVDRMIAAARFEQGVRGFFADMFAYDQFDGLSKDQSIYPKYTSQLAKDAQEQTLRTIVDLLVTNKGDYRDLFTTKKTFMNRSLGSLYKIPMDAEAVEGWVPYTFTASDQRGGILSFAAFLMLDPTHEGRSSPTIRGKSVRELFLCQRVPLPPPDVNFDIVQNTHNTIYKTARDRLTAHRANPTCAGCHAVMDPIGLGIENYDGIGQHRTHENGALIDASGAFDTKQFKNLVELQRIIRSDPNTANCVADRVYAYGVGRKSLAGEREWIDYLHERFADDRYAFGALMRRVAVSQAFRAVSDSGSRSSNH